MNPGGVLVIGIDGGTWDVLRPLALGGVMPNLRRFVDAGVATGLASVVPWYTVPGWSSLMLGANPGRHGVVHWVHAETADYWENRRAGRRFSRSGDFPLPTFWDVAGAAGKRVAIANMPLTYPAWPVNGVMVSGLLTPTGEFPGRSYPEGFVDRYPEYRVDLRHAKGGEAEGKLPPLPALLREMVAVTESRKRLMTDLAVGDHDLVVAVFVGMDRVSHRAWPAQERLVSSAATGTSGAGEGNGEIEGLLADYYRSLDGVIGSLVDAAGPDATTLLVSDHGFGPGPTRKVRVNAWLREAGYLRLRGGRLQERAFRAEPVRRIAKRAIRAWRRRATRPAEHPGIDWSASSAYAVHFSWCPLFGVVLNERGVKRQGSVNPARIPALIEDLSADLRGLRDEDGSEVVRGIIRREEVADGPHLDRLPHLFVEVDPRYFPDDGLRQVKVFDDLRTESGQHVREGMLGALGSRVDRSFAGSARIEDVAPTVLALLGLGAPAEMDGTVLADLVRTSGRLEAAPDADAPSDAGVELSEDDQAAIERHLRELGYEE